RAKTYAELAGQRWGDALPHCFDPRRAAGHILLASAADPLWRPRCQTSEHEVAAKLLTFCASSHENATNFEVATDSALEKISVRSSPVIASDIRFNSE